MLISLIVILVALLSAILAALYVERARQEVQQELHGRPTGQEYELLRERLSQAQEEAAEAQERLSQAQESLSQAQEEEAAQAQNDDGELERLRHTATTLWDRRRHSLSFSVPLVAPDGDGPYATMRVKPRQRPGTFNVDIINTETGDYSGSGEGDVRTLLRGFERLKERARTLGGTRLICTVYTADGKGYKRARVYKRAGFVAHPSGHMEMQI